MTRSDTARTRFRRGDEQLLAALSVGATQPQAAAMANVSVATVKRRMRDPEFRATLAEATQEAAERTTRALTAAGPVAVATLVRLCRNADTPPAVQRSAAASLLAFAVGRPTPRQPDEEYTPEPLPTFEQLEPELMARFDAIQQQWAVDEAIAAALDDPTRYRSGP